MNTQQEKIKFYLDKNIWSHKIMEMSSSELEDFNNLIKPLKEQSKIEIYYSPINLLELIKGLELEEHFPKCQEEVRLALKMTDKHLLEYPWDHIQRIGTWFLGRSFKKPDLTFLNLCIKIAVSSSFHEIEREVQSIRKVLTNFEPKWVEDLNSIKLSLEKLGLKADEYRNKESVLYRKQRLWISFCDHYALSTELKNSTFHFVYQDFHSFRYWVNYRVTYENKFLFENWSPKPSDYLDWQQVVYLNIMDYIVTEDAKLRIILKECENEEIHRVVMSFDEFIGRLSESPPKRAPETTTEQWYNAK